MNWATGWLSISPACWGRKHSGGHSLWRTSDGSATSVTGERLGSIEGLQGTYQPARWLGAEPSQAWRLNRRWAGHSPGLSARRSRERASGTRPSGGGSSWLGRRSVGLRPGNRLNIRLRGKQLHGTGLKALVRGRGVRRCVSGHIRGGRKGVTRAAGIRQVGRRGPPIGKDLLYGHTGWDRDARRSPSYRRTLTADFAIAPLVRPIWVM